MVRPSHRKCQKGGFVPLSVPRTSPLPAVQVRNDFPLFQATVLLLGHGFLVIPGTSPGMTKIWDRQAITQTGH